MRWGSEEVVAGILVRVAMSCWLKKLELELDEEILDPAAFLLNGVKPYQGLISLVRKRQPLPKS